ncbi:hypothetical protein [Lacinutrix sp. Hel_I_90]|uniref:hypothetical protein n=1 Tax=Lacinutrix sp. Hel_I_90 TaxID=1249999 RepID=UPI0005CA64E9|nr:hypothetical protein [Lacinutrix sp. Hel_I_90]
MKTRKKSHLKGVLLIGLIFITVNSCERSLSDEAEFATYQNTSGIFIDGFVGGLDYFPFSGSFAEAFSVDTNEKYLGSASMRFDIPQFGVGYGGATFPSTSPRDLSSYDALTFWARASQGADINEIGFGINGDTNDKFKVTLQNLPLTTLWTKYVIAIPDASKLNQEKGMFWYAEGAENATDEGGYTFWIDELKFEKLGTIAQSRPAILNGVDTEQQTFIGTDIILTGLTQTYNLASGMNQTVSCAPSYFTFSSSNIDVAIVNERGVVSIIGTGTATITASLGGVLAQGSLTLESSGALATATVPTLPASNVISVFSNAYNSVPVDFFNADWEGSTTQTTNINVGGDDIKYYTQNNFVGIGFENPTINATTMTHMHIDIYTEDVISGNFEIQIRDRGSNGQIDSDGNGFPTADDKDLRYTVSSIPQGEWTSIDIPLEGNLATQKNNLALIVFVGGVANFYIDNIYFYN